MPPAIAASKPNRTAPIEATASLEAVGSGVGASASDGDGGDSVGDDTGADAGDRAGDGAGDSAVVGTGDDVGDDAGAAANARTGAGRTAGAVGGTALGGGGRCVEEGTGSTDPGAGEDAAGTGVNARQGAGRGEGRDDRVGYARAPHGTPTGAVRRPLGGDRRGGRSGGGRGC